MILTCFWYVVCVLAFTDSEVKKMKASRASTDEETPELKEAFRKARTQRPLQTKLNHLDSANSDCELIHINK